MKSNQASSSRVNLIENLTNNLTSKWTISSSGNLTVNGQAVLIRTAAQNTHLCVELYHEDNQARWVKSWGMTTPNRYMVLLMGDTSYWYDISKLKTLISEGIVSNTLSIVNNSHQTRSNNKPSSNVMNVWVPLLNKALLTSHSLNEPINVDKYIGGY